MFNLFRLLENKTLKIFSIRERRESRHRFGGTEVCKAEEVRKYFVNLEIELKVFSYIICTLDFKNISCAQFLLHMKTMNGVVSWYILALCLLFHFIVCVSFLSIFFLFFLSIFVSSITSCGIEVSLAILKIKQWSCSYVPTLSFKG